MSETDSKADLLIAAVTRRVLVGEDRIARIEIREEAGARTIIVHIGAPAPEPATPKDDAA